MLRRRWKLLAAITAVAVVLVGVGVWYFVFRDDSPAAVTLRSATKHVERRSGDDPASIDGQWTVNSEIGSFANFTDSFAGFRVEEQLAGIGAKTAVGRTPDVTGSLTIDGTSIPETSIKVDMTTLTTDEARRDDAIRHQAIETDRFPEATFTLTEPIELDAAPKDGTKVDVQAVGDLTLHGVTKQVTFPLQAQLNGDVITVTGSLEIQFADYDIQKPRAAIVLSVEDKGVIEVQLFFTKK
jgi:polyisoprenoid-binding protein YceI